MSVQWRECVLRKAFAPPLQLLGRSDAVAAETRPCETMSSWLEGAILTDDSRAACNACAAGWKLDAAVSSQCKRHG